MAHCGDMPATFFEMFASCIRKNRDGDTFVNSIAYEEDCEDTDSAITCDNPATDPEAFIVANAFGVDSCGNPALKICVTDLVPT